MAQVGKTIFFCKFLFCVAYRAGNIDQHDVGAFFANEVIVVFMGIPEFVVAAGTLEIHFVNQMQFLHQQNHPEYRGIVGLGSGKSHRALLDFLERHGLLRCKETLEDASTVFGDSQSLFAQGLGDAVGGEMRNHTRLATIGIPYGNALAGKMRFCIRNGEFSKMKNTRSEDGISETRPENVSEMLEFSCPPAGNDRDLNGA